MFLVKPKQNAESSALVEIVDQTWTSQTKSQMKSGDYFPPPPSPISSS